MASTAITGDVLSRDDAGDRLSETFAALAHPARRAILQRLAQGEASVGELAAPFDMTLPAVSRHIRVLERAGLVSQGRRAQYRPCTLEAEPLDAVTAWADDLREIWNGRFDRMDAYVRELADVSPPNPDATTRPQRPERSERPKRQKRDDR